MRHLDGRIQGGLLCKQGGIDDVDPVIGIGPTSHERIRRLTAHQSYLDIDAVGQEFIRNRSWLSMMLSRGYGKEIQLTLDPFTRLSMYESHRRRRICRLHVSWASALALSRHCSDSFLRRRAFYMFKRSHAMGQKVTHQSLTSIRDASLGCSSTQRHGTSLDEWHGAAQQTT